MWAGCCSKYSCQGALQVHRLQQLWRNTATVRVHQRQLLFMQLQRFAERHAAKLVRTGAAFLSGATLSATAASATRKSKYSVSDQLVAHDLSHAT